MGAGRGFAALVGCRGAVVVLLTSAVAALVGCRGAVVVLLTPAVAALVGCRGAVGGLRTPAVAALPTRNESAMCVCVSSSVLVLAPSRTG